MSEEQQNQPTGIVGEIVEGLHNLEQKVDHLIHGDTAPSSSEPVQEAGAAAPGEAGSQPDTADTAAGAGSATQIEGASPVSDALVTGIADSAPVVAASGEVGAADSGAETIVTDAANTSVSPSTSHQSDAATPGASGEAGNAVPEASTAEIASGQSLSMATDGAAVNAEGGEGSDDPNAAAPTAGDSSASDTQSSASPVSQVGVGLAIAASVSEAISSRVYMLRKHFWTFDEATRAPFIKLLDEIEALVK